MRTLFLIDNGHLAAISHLTAIYPDILIFSEEYQGMNANSLKSAKSILGKSIPYAIFDCRKGFALDYFLCLANAIQKNGALFLLYAHNDYDDDSLRFSDKKQKTPNFKARLNIALNKFSQPYHKAILNVQPSHLSYELSKAQLSIIERLQTYQRGIFTLFAARGTGKSTLSNRLIDEIKKSFKYAITSPNQSAINAYNDKNHFYAPDYLLLNAEKFKMSSLDYLIIEEAGQIPLQHIQSLSTLAKKTLIISSIENYEGTGKGLSYKLQDLITINESFSLNETFRFDKNDEIAKFCDDITFSQTINPLKLDQAITIFENETLAAFQKNNELIAAFYHLMNETHYQSNIQDLRRILDNQHQIFITATDCQHKMLIGGIWGLKEGELNADLAEAVFNGIRRPKGNLVVQTLAAHSYYPELMLLKSLRISRIFVDTHHRKQNIATQMIKKLINYAENNGFDFLSVSFGLTENLLSFWQKLGFTWIHIGSHKDKTTGLHAAIMILPLTESLKKWLMIAENQFFADAIELKHAPFFDEKSKKLLPNFDQNISISANSHLDKKAYNAYKNYKKPELSIYATLSRQQKNKTK